MFQLSNLILCLFLNFYFCESDGTSVVITLEDNKMPNAIVTNYANVTKKSVEEIEKSYQKAKEIVEKQYPKVEKDSDAYYKLVNGVLKNMLSIKEDESQATTNLTTMGDYSYAKKVGCVQTRFKTKESVCEEFKQYMVSRK